MNNMTGRPEWRASSRPGGYGSQPDHIPEILDHIREHTRATAEAVREIREDRRLTTAAVLRLAETEALIRKWTPRVVWIGAWLILAAMQLGVAPVAEIVKRLLAP